MSPNECCACDHIFIPLAFVLVGTNISLYGTLSKPSSRGPPSATFTIDNSAPEAFNATGSITVPNYDINTSHILFYQSPVLAQGQHTLTVRTGTSASGPTAPLYVDFLTIATGLDNVSGDVIVDDEDPSITYTGTWKIYDSRVLYMGTSRQSPTTAAGGTATFRFNGMFAPSAGHQY